MVGGDSGKPWGSGCIRSQGMLAVLGLGRMVNGLWSRGIGSFGYGGWVRDSGDCSGLRKSRLGV